MTDEDKEQPKEEESSPSYLEKVQEERKNIESVLKQVEAKELAIKELIAKQVLGGRTEVGTPIVEKKMSDLDFKNDVEERLKRGEDLGIKF